MANILKDFFYTGLWASGYIRSNRDPKKEPQTFPVTIRDIEIFGDVLTNQFTLSCKSVRLEWKEKKFRKMDSFKVKGSYHVDRNERGYVESVTLWMHDNPYTIKNGDCVSLPIPNGQAYFAFTSKMPKPDRNLSPAFFEHTDEQMRSILELCGDGQLQGCSVEEFSHEGMLDADLSDEFDFEALFE
jgi:hypothetical protein